MIFRVGLRHKLTGVDQRTDRFARSVLFDPLELHEATCFFLPLCRPETGGGPSLNMVAVITSTNFNTRGMHDLTDAILAKYVVGAAR